jgi:hypothetical protein
MNFNDFTLEQFRTFDPFAAKFLSRHFPENYEKFIEALYDDLVQIVKKFEETRSLRQDDGEDRITSDICILLEQLGTYSATHGTDASGAVDITVTHGRNAYKWLGEAKIYTSVTAVLEGFKQLTTRYSLAAPEFKTGLLIYVFSGDRETKMATWQEKLSGENLPNFVASTCHRRPTAHFYSEHKHASSGSRFQVWHVGIDLHYLPQDKSGIATRRRRASKRS